MTHQNFLSQESFVEATEIQAKESLLSIPVFANHIRLLAENKKLHSFQFSYYLPKTDMEYNVTVTLLPLNPGFTRVSLRGTHLDGQCFQEDLKMAVALKDFESAINAAIKGDSGLYKPYKPKEKKSIQLNSIFTAPAGLFLLRKKLS